MPDAGRATDSSRRFGRENGKKHGALDLNGAVGDPVFAALDGLVAVASLNWGAMGNTVIIDHGAGAYTVYGHLQAVFVKERDPVRTGIQVGTVLLGERGRAQAGRFACPLPLRFDLSRQDGFS